MSVERHEKAVTKRKGALKHLPIGICQALAIPEDVTIVTHEVIRHKQLTSECLIIEETCHITHHLFEIIALLDDMVSEILLRIPLADIGFMELFHIVIIVLKEIIESLLVIIRQLAVFENLIECFLTHAALAVKLARETLIILKHQLWIFLICVKLTAHINELIIIIELNNGKISKSSRLHIKCRLLGFFAFMADFWILFLGIGFSYFVQKYTYFSIGI